MSNPEFIEICSVNNILVEVEKCLTVLHAQSSALVCDGVKCYAAVDVVLSSPSIEALIAQYPRRIKI